MSRSNHRKGFRILRWVLGVPAVIVLGALSIYVWAPQWIPLNWAVERLGPRFVPETHAVQWRGLHARLSGPGFRRKILRLRLQDAEVRAKSGDFQVAVENLELVAQIELKGFRLGVRSVDLLRVGRASARMKPDSSPSATESDPTPSGARERGLSEKLAAWGSKIRGPVSLENLRFALDEPGTEIRLDGALDHRPKPGGGRWEFRVDGSTRTTGMNLRHELRANAEFAGTESDRLPEILITHRAVEGKRSNLITHARVIPGGPSAGKFSVRSRGKLSGNPLQLDLQVQIEPGTVIGTLDARYSTGSQAIGKVQLDRCRLTAGREGRRKLVDLAFSCRVGGRTPPFPGLPGPVHLVAAAEIPRLDLDETPLRPVGEWSLELTPVSSSLLRAEARIEGGFGRKGHPVSVNLTHVRAELRHFRNWVPILNRQALLVPAPFHVLDGTVVVSAEGGGDWIADRAALKLRFETDLRSEQQTFKWQGAGDAGLSLSPFGLNLAMTVNSSDVLLVVPDLGLEMPSVILPDSRLEPRKLVEKGRTQEPAPSIRYELKIVAPASAPIRLKSNLSSSPIEFEGAFTLSDGKSEAALLKARPFSLHIFRRVSEVEKLEAQLNAKSQDLFLDAALRVEFPEASVHIVITGNVDRPKLALSSNPPLPEFEIVSLLVFGRTLSALDPDEVQSVGSVRAAMAEGAISLSSMYLLASTPIRSVSYDPVHKSWAARVSVGQNTTVMVGSDVQRRDRVGISRRLTRRWSLESELRKDEEEETNVSTVLRWKHRY